MSNFYVTTAIAYVNGEPHLGHAMEFVIGDVVARYMRQHGTPVIYSTGTDEHGGKIAEKAEQLGKTPKQLADEVSKQFKDLMDSLNVDYDRFVRTTNPDHEKRSQIV
jgi:methionyl-tRNA synthetase